MLIMVFLLKRILNHKFVLVAIEIAYSANNTELIVYCHVLLSSYFVIILVPFNGFLLNAKSTYGYLKMCLFGCSSEERSAEARAREAERNLSLILELIRLSKDKASGESDSPQVRFWLTLCVFSFPACI